jgi:hypothetical protein
VFVHEKIAINEQYGSTRRKVVSFFLQNHKWKRAMEEEHPKVSC